LPEPSPRRVATTIGVLFAAQVLAMLLFLGGGIWLIVTVAYNNSHDCTLDGLAAVSCGHRSYAAPIGVLATGFGLFLAGMVTSVIYGMRHVGAPALGAVALFLRRRRAEEDVEGGA
jgi:hypothetical protein